VIPHTQGFPFKIFEQVKFEIVRPSTMCAKGTHRASRRCAPWKGGLGGGGFAPSENFENLDAKWCNLVHS